MYWHVKVEQHVCQVVECSDKLGMIRRVRTAGLANRKGIANRIANCKHTSE
jgi:hypothetical protein